jgi:hypothetical protein
MWASRFWTSASLQGASPPKSCSAQAIWDEARRSGPTVGNCCFLQPHVTQDAQTARSSSWTSAPVPIASKPAERGRTWLTCLYTPPACTSWKRQQPSSRLVSALVNKAPKAPVQPTDSNCQGPPTHHAWMPSPPTFLCCRFRTLTAGAADPRPGRLRYVDRVQRFAQRSAEKKWEKG